MPNINPHPFQVGDLVRVNWPNAMTNNLHGLGGRIERLEGSYWVPAMGANHGRVQLAHVLIPGHPKLHVIGVDHLQPLGE